MLALAAWACWIVRTLPLCIRPAARLTKYVSTRSCGLAVRLESKLTIILINPAIAVLQPQSLIGHAALLAFSV